MSISFSIKKKWYQDPLHGKKQVLIFQNDHQMAKTELCLRNTKLSLLFQCIQTCDSVV